MRNITLMLAAAPLALLAACGDADTDETATDTAMMEDDSAMEEEDMAATSLEEAGDFSGDYTMTADDGTTTSVSLNSQDDTYSYTAEDGTMREGSFTRGDDGYRLMISDWWGEPAWFTFSNGRLIKLAGDTPVTADTMVRGDSYVRGNATNDGSMGSREAMETGEMDDGDDAVFSREPEIGSPVTPED